MKIRILLLVGLISSVCEMFVMKRTPTVYQAEENDNVTIGWDSRIKTDMSRTNLVCFLQSKPLKVLYEMLQGVKVPESQHQQFAGRVQCDQDALREGRIRLHLSRVTADDSGDYWCDLATSYDKTARRWMLEATEQFVLNVTSAGDNSDVFLTTPELNEGAKHKPGGSKMGFSSRVSNKVKIVPGALIGVIVLGVGLIFLASAAAHCLSFFS